MDQQQQIGLHLPFCLSQTHHNIFIYIICENKSYLIISLLFSKLNQIDKSFFSQGALRQCLPNGHMAHRQREDTRIGTELFMGCPQIAYCI